MRTAAVVAVVVVVADTVVVAVVASIDSTDLETASNWSVGTADWVVGAVEGC